MRNSVFEAAIGLAEDTDLDQADKLVQECVGYKASQGLCAITFALSGILGLLAGISPRLAVLSLLQCPLSTADWVLVKLIDGRQRLVKVVRFKPTKPQGSDAFCPDELEVHTFRLFLRLYTFDPQKLTFRPVPRMPHHLPHQISKALGALHLIATAGASWKTFNLGHTHRRKDIIKLYGNKRRLLSKGLEVKTTKELIPLFVLQSLELVFLAYQQRWFYPVLCWTLTFVVSYLFARFSKVQDHKIMNLINTATAVRKVNFVPDEGIRYNPDRHSSSTVYANTTVQQVWNAEDVQEEVLAMIVRTGFHTVMGSMVQELIAPTKVFKQKIPFTSDVLRFYLFGLVVHVFILIPYFIKVQEHQESAEDVIIRVLNYMVYAAPPGIVTIMACSGLIARFRLAKEDLTLMYPETLALAADLDMVCFDKTGTLTHSSAELHGMLPVKNRCFEPLQHTAVSWSNVMKQAAAVCNSLTMVNKSIIVGQDVERNLFKAVEARFKDRETVILPRKPSHHNRKLFATLKIVKILEFSSQTLRSGVVVLASDGPPNSARLFLRGAPAIIRDLVQPSSVPQDFNQVVDDYSTNSFRLMAVAAGIVPDINKLDLPNMSQQAIEAAAVGMELLALIVLANSIRDDSVATIKELQETGGLRCLIITGDYHHTALAVAKQAGMLSGSSNVVIVDTCKQSDLPAQPSLTQQVAAMQHTSSAQTGTSSATVRILPESLLIRETYVPAAPRLEPMESSLGNREEGTHGAASAPKFRFVSSEHDQELEQSQALAALAEGHTQCAVTGPALESLLQQQDLSPLEVILRNAVVFARMQPYQKGQVMDLVTCRGIHLRTVAGSRYVPGLGHTAMSCGDGINDLAALAAADVGMAIGATDATIAAAVFSSRPSVAGTVSFIRTGKAAPAMLIGLFKYMMVYQFALAEANVLAFWMDGSSLTYTQDLVVDFQAMTMALAALLVLPLPKLNRHKPPIALCTRTQLTHLAIMALCLFAFHILQMSFLATRPWFKGGTGTQNENPVTTVAWLTCLGELLAPLIGVTIDTSLFCQSIFRSRLLLFLAVLYTSYVHISMFTSPAAAFPTLKLSHDLPQSFRVQWYGLIIGGIFAYTGVVNGTRRLLNKWSEQRRTHPL